MIVVALLFCTTQAASQVSPNLKWRTLHGVHFRVHFSPGLEDLAQLSLSRAEEAYVKLARELKAPRGKIDIVVADNRDFANGYAAVFPTNRFVIYAMPPVDTPNLRGANDWLANLITHELVHVFHLDRAEGLWRIPRFLFGRNPSMMPNLYSPAWIREGLAVYYESKLTGSGRLGSGEFQMLLRGSAESKAIPGVGDLSITTSRTPEGQTPYLFGAYLIKHLADKGSGGDDKMDRFVGSMSAQIIPWMSSSAARSQLGISFGRAWRDFRDSVELQFAVASPAATGWRPLTFNERVTWHPRWLTPDTLIYARSDGRSSTGLYSLSITGESERIARRNSVSVNSPGPDGSIVFAQPEYLNPYEIRYDLYRRDSTGKEVRLTHGARLISPDVREDGEIVAVQASGGSSAIVRISPSDAQVTPVVLQSQGEYWADPRWSPDGRSIAAVRRRSSGVNSLVVLRENATPVTLANGDGRETFASPSWLDNNRVLFQRDSVRPQVALATISGSSVVITNVTAASTGVLQPEASPDNGNATRSIAAVEYRTDGYRIVVGSLTLVPASTASLPTVSLYRPEQNSSAGPAATTTPLSNVEAKDYSAWRYMLPRYWVPLATVSENESNVIGASTSAYDVVDRHAWAATALINLGDGAVEANARYSYSGFVNPTLHFSAAQVVDYTGIFSGTGPGRERLGFLREWGRSFATSLQFFRPRYRNALSFSIGADFERLTYDSDPAALLGQVTNFDPSARDFVSAAASLGWSNTRRPALSISPEDGISFSITARERWRTDISSSAAASVTTSLRAFKSLDLPGFAHHVLATRLALGLSNTSSTSRFGVGGKSGSKLELFPGYSIGDVGRTFPVRGFPPGSLVGLRAASASLEYRVPIAMPSQGLGMFPLFFDRISLALFGDAGAAWCGASQASSSRCDDVPTSPDQNWLASAGAELNIDAALQYDVPYRLRFGVANILRKPEDLVAKSREFYFTLGFPF